MLVCNPPCRVACWTKTELPDMCSMRKSQLFRLWAAIWAVEHFYSKEPAGDSWGIFSATVQEHMWKEAGFSESCVFSQLFANVQGFHLCCLRASLPAGSKYNYYFFANGFLNSSIDHLYKQQTKKRRQKAVLSCSLYSLRAQQHVSRKRGNGSAVSCLCVDRSRRSQLRDKQRLKSWRWWIHYSIR